MVAKALPTRISAKGDASQHIAIARYFQPNLITFYVVSGAIRIFLQQPKEEVRLTPGQTYSVPPKRPHLVTNAGDTSAVFLVLQGIGEYDFVPLT